MCQLGAVLVSSKRVFRRDGVLHHGDLRSLAIVQHPRESFHEAEYNFETRQWEFMHRIPKRLHPQLHAFAKRHWSSVERLMRFVLHAGPLGRDTVLTRAAQGKFNKLTRAALNERYREMGEADQLWMTPKKQARKYRAGEKAYNKVAGPIWCNLFADPKNRIPIWREPGE